MKENTSVKKGQLKKVEYLKSIMLKLCGVLLGGVAIVGIKAADRYVPLWLSISFGASVVVLIVLYLYAYFLKKKIEE